jgi:hypothetical protein
LSAGCPIIRPLGTKLLSEVETSCLVLRTFMSIPRKRRGESAEEQGAKAASIRRFLELDKRCTFPSQPLSSLIFLYHCTKPNKTRDIVTKKSLGCRLWISSIALFWCIHSTCFWGIAWPQIGCQIRGDSQGARMQATDVQYYVKFQNPNVKNHESQAQRRGQYVR